MSRYWISALSAHLSADFDVADWPGAWVTVASAATATSLSRYRRAVLETARLCWALSQTLIKSARAAPQVYFHFFASLQTKTVFFFCSASVCFQGCRKTEAVCVGPPLRKAASRVPPWARPHRQHSRTGQKIQHACAHTPFTHTNTNVTKQSSQWFPVVLSSYSGQVGGAKVETVNWRKWELKQFDVLLISVAACKPPSRDDI